MGSNIFKAQILLPGENTDITKWAVIACDQFTSEPDYWEKLGRLVGDSPSMLHVTYPEIYLKEKDGEKRIASINGAMRGYLSGVLTRSVYGCVLTVRSTPFTAKRVGLVAAVDLEDYSFRIGDKAIIRATEGTILERIPPRVKIRKGASLESPHIMLLLSDEKKSVIEPLYNRRAEFEKLYDFDLNMGGGHIEGYRVEDIQETEQALTALLKESENICGEKFLFAVGDGNHSLATAKTCWEEIKTALTEEERERHPARFALVEIVNIFDEGINFEPIHRVVFGAGKRFCEGLAARLSKYSRPSFLVTCGKRQPISLPDNAVEGVRVVQEYIDEALRGGEIESVDYVHGEESVESITAKNPESMGILLHKMNKADLFPAVAKCGALPRKTFSMGEAVEKRYYLECRSIIDVD